MKMDVLMKTALKKILMKKMARQIKFGLLTAGLVSGFASQAMADSPAYVPLQGDHKILVMDSHTLEPLAVIPTDGQSIDTRLLPNGTKLYAVNVESTEMTVVRTKCPSDDSQWTDGEREQGFCVPNSKLKSVTIEGSGGFYFSVRDDSKYIYVSSITTSADGEVTAYINVVDTLTDTIVNRLVPPPENMSIANEISPDGKTIWTASANGYVQGLNPETGEPTTPAIFVGLVPATKKFSPDGKRLFVANMPPGTMEGGDTSKLVATVAVVDIETNTLIKSIELTPGSSISGIEVVAKKNQVWTANSNSTFTVIDMTSLEVLKTITVPFTTGEALDVSPDGERALFVSFNGPLINPERGQPDDTSPTYVQLYSTTTFEPISDAVFVGNNSGGIPSLSAE